jgi:hypothetical protein
MAPYVLVLAGLGAAAVLEAIPPERRRRAAVALGALIVISAAFEVAAFARWGASPRTWGAFGGPERELADALVAASRSGPPARVVLDAPGAARNPYVVEELLAPPGARRGPVVAFRDLTDAHLALGGNVLYADGGALAAAGLAGRRGRVVARGIDPWGAPTFTVYRLSPD